MQNLLERMNSFNAEERKQALMELINKNNEYTKEGTNVNMHFHSFNSYNCENWSPTRIAFESKQRGLYATGIIDFDVIDGRDEFLEASELLGLRASVGIETRAFHTEFSNREVDSPGEPGVSYIAGAGFVTPFEENSQQAKTLAKYRQKALERNLALIQRINAAISIISIDYYEDVIPLTPSGNATERHIIQAYIKKTNQRYPDKIALQRIWSEIFGKTVVEVDALFQNIPALEDAVRAKIAKKGGVGYVQPTIDTFPKMEEFFAWTKSCGAIPLESWLDGTSAGESDPVKLLELSRQKGAMGLNIIPDRNWNIKDPELKSLKYNKLKEIIAVASSMDMPLHIGTEMNKMGLPFTDDLEGLELKPFKKQFITGAKIFIGHSVLQRFAGFSYVSKEAEMTFKTTKLKNDFFAMVGELPPITKSIADKLRNAGKGKSLILIQDALKSGKW